MKAFRIAVAVLCTGAALAWAQDAPSADPADAAALADAAAQNPELAGQAAKLFGFGFDLGVDSLPIPGDLTGANDSYQRFGFKPELNLGAFGVGLDLTLRAKINLVGPTPIDVYRPDWIPNYLGNGKTFLDVYLPKILFVRYGQRGQGIYAKLGSIEDLTIGNGFIMGNYSNTRFLPEQRIFGLGLGLDGSLFKFPYLGAEFAMGNLSQIDVLGGRLYTRPLAFMSVPILQSLEFGGEYVMDLKPYLYGGTVAAYGGAAVAGAKAQVWGVDAKMTIIPSGPLTMGASADIAVQEGDRLGAAIGLAGRIINVITYGAQIRYLPDGFIADYFDSNYDLYRSVKYESLLAAPSGPPSAGWYAQAGANFLDGKVVFGAALDGPFAAKPAVATSSVSDYPHLKASIGTADGLLGGFSINGSYEKYYLGRTAGFWTDLGSPENAQIGATLSYKTGLALISLVYNLRYDPALGTFDVTSSLQASVQY